MTQTTPNRPKTCETAGHVFHDLRHKWAATKKGIEHRCYRCGAVKTPTTKGVR